MRTKENLHRKERGQSIVEFAFGLVILFMVLSGLVDIGRALFTFMAMREAAQEGALYGSTDPAADNDIIDRVCNNSNYLQGYSCGAAGSDMVVTKTITGPVCSGSAITVEVAYDDFPITMPYLGAILGRQTIAIRASITDTILTPFKCPTP